jgi:nitrile hydratase
MNGIHDMGGMHGFGAVEPEVDEPVFHHDWERQVFALSLAAPGSWNLDQDRHANENRPPHEYLTLTYYEIWLSGLEKLLTSHGLLLDEEVRQGASIAPPDETIAALHANDVDELVFAPSSLNQDTADPAAFAVGDAVRARNMHPRGHTRLPRYARGRAGTIAHVYGCQTFPDASARGEGEQPKWLYSVEFTASELWGADGVSGDSVFIDLWEPYLEEDR